MLRYESVGVFVDVDADPFDRLRRLLAGSANHIHQFCGHLSGYLILHAAFAVRIGLQEFHNFFFVDAGSFQSVEKLAEAHFTTQLFNHRQKPFAVAANSTEKSRALAAINTLTHNDSRYFYITFARPPPPPRALVNCRVAPGGRRPRLYSWPIND